MSTTTESKYSWQAGGEKGKMLHVCKNVKRLAKGIMGKMGWGFLLTRKCGGVKIKMIENHAHSHGETSNLGVPVPGPLKNPV